MGKNQSREIFENNGNKQILMDLDSFKKRPIYKEVPEEELQEAIRKM